MNNEFSFVWGFFFWGGGSKILILHEFLIPRFRCFAMIKIAIIDSLHNLISKVQNCLWSILQDSENSLETPGDFLQFVFVCPSASFLDNIA